MEDDREVQAYKLLVAVLNTAFDQAAKAPHPAVAFEFRCVGREAYEQTVGTVGAERLRDVAWFSRVVARAFRGQVQGWQEQGIEDQYMLLQRADIEECWSLLADTLADILES